MIIWLFRLFFNTLFLVNYNYAGPISVSCGGTGFAKIPAHGILCSHPDLDKLHIIESGQSGLILCSAEQGCNPVFIQPTAGAGLSVISTDTVFEYALQTPIEVSSGGTGHTAISAHAVLVGQDDVELGIVTPSMTSGIPLISQGPFADPIFGTVTVAGGGTGQTSFPRNAVLLGQLNSAIAAVAPGTDGQIFLGATQKAPSFVTPTVGTGLTMKSDAKTLQYSLKVPVDVEHGGTGRSVIAAYSLLAGGVDEKSSLQTLSSCGDQGDVLFSNGPNALPSWRALPEQSCTHSSCSELPVVVPVVIETVESVYSHVIMQLQSAHMINPEIVNAVTIGTASINAGTNCVILKTGTTVNSSVMLQSKMRVQCQNGNGCKMIVSCCFGSGIKETIQMVGWGTEKDGFFFGYNGNLFGILHRNNSVDTWIVQKKWNVDSLDGFGVSQMTLDPSKGNVYQIQFQYSDFGRINFFVQNSSTGAMTLIHKLEYGNAYKSSVLSNASLPFMAQVWNASQAKNTELSLFSVSVFSQFIIQNQIDVRNSVQSGKKINNEITNLVTISNNEKFQNQQNQGMVYPDCLSITNASASIAIFTLYLNSAVAGSPIFKNINDQTSIVSYDVLGTGVCGGKQLISFFVNNGSFLTVNLRDYGIMLSPGDRLTVACATSQGISNVYASLSWLERY